MTVHFSYFSVAEKQNRYINKPKMQIKTSFHISGDDNNEQHKIHIC